MLAYVGAWRGDQESHQRRRDSGKAEPLDNRELGLLVCTGQLQVAVARTRPTSEEMRTDTFSWAGEVLNQVLVSFGDEDTTNRVHGGLRIRVLRSRGMYRAGMLPVMLLLDL